MVIVDSSVWIDFLNGVSNPQTGWLKAELYRTRLGLTYLILCEVLQGIRDEDAFTETRRLLSAVETIHTGGEDLAVASARNYRALRAAGFTIRKTIDCLIATFCMMEDHILLHLDRDFDLFVQHLSLKVIPMPGETIQ